MKRPHSRQMLIEKLKVRVHDLIYALQTHANDLKIHQHIDQFYYMQKIAELEFMNQQYNDGIERFDMLCTHKYAEVFKRWQRDIRWLSKYLRTATVGL